jgi:hypothetical protein
MTNTQRLLELALKGLEVERAKLDNEIAGIKAQLNGGGKSGQLAQVKPLTSAAATTRKRRRMSAEAKRRISEGMKRRYAEMRKGLKSSTK